MRKDLRRIEVMLAQFTDQRQSEPIKPGSASTVRPQTVQLFSTLRQPAGAPWKKPEPQLGYHQPVLPPLIATSSVSEASSATAVIERTHRTPAVGTVKTPSLPRLTSSALSSDPPTLTSQTAIDELRAIERVAIGWQDEYEQLWLQIEAIYAEGPIVDGWLEAYESTEDAAQTIQIDSSVTLPSVAPAQTAAGYRLCGFSRDGQLWFCHCPVEQVAAVKLAIERHERLKHLLTRKQSLDALLGNLAEALVIIHEQLDDSKP